MGYVEWAQDTAIVIKEAPSNDLALSLACNVLPTGVISLHTVVAVAFISKKEHSLPCLTEFLPCSITYQLIVSTFKVIKGLNFCKTYQNL